MRIKILSARREVFAGEVREVVLPGEDGELSVLDFHQPCILRLNAGKIRMKVLDIKEAVEREQELVIARGLARVDLQSLSILIEEVVTKKT